MTQYPAATLMSTAAAACPHCAAVVLRHTLTRDRAEKTTPSGRGIFRCVNSQCRLPFMFTIWQPISKGATP